MSYWDIVVKKIPGIDAPVTGRSRKSPNHNRNNP